MAKREEGLSILSGVLLQKVQDGLGFTSNCMFYNHRPPKIFSLEFLRIITDIGCSNSHKYWRRIEFYT